MLPELFALALPFPPCDLRGDLFFGPRQELRALALEVKIVFGKRTEHG